MSRGLLLSLAAILPCLGASAAVPPAHPATLTNIEGYWVGQSEPTPVCRVADIAMTATPAGSDLRVVVATVLMTPPHEGPVPSARIGLSWTLPNGAQRIEHAYTDGDGIAHFALTGPKGLYQVSIIEFKKTGYALDKTRSEMTEHLDAR